MQNATFPARERNDKKHEKETAYVFNVFYFNCTGTDFPAADPLRIL
jgi:hypothetical protein